MLYKLIMPYKRIAFSHVLFDPKEEAEALQTPNPQKYELRAATPPSRVYTAVAEYLINKT